MRPFRLLHLAFILLILSVAACIPPGPETTELPAVVVDLNDPVTRRIYDHQNNRAQDSLRRYLTHPNPSYRYLAARGLGSFSDLDPASTAALAGQLRSPSELVRSAAAYALGQTGAAAAADSLTRAFDGANRYRLFNAEVLASVGKTGDADLQEFLAGITTYTAADTVLASGRAWGLYYFARRGVQSAAGDQLMLDHALEPTTPAAVLLPAAYYLKRFPVTVGETTEARLRERLRATDDPDLLMGLVRTIGRAGLPAGRVALLRALDDQPDWRVRTEVIRALAGYDYTGVREAVLMRLRDDHPQVRRAAANFLRDNGRDTDATFIRELARDSTQTDVRYVLYAAAQRHLPLYFADYRGFLNYDLQQAYAATTDAYQRADILAALGEYPWNYRNIYELYEASDQPVVRSAAAEALRKISNREDFLTFFKRSSRRVRYDLSTYFRAMIYGREVGPAYAAANALIDQPTVYQPFYPELDWMSTALREFELPRDVEAYRAVEAALAALRNQPAPTPRPLDAPARAIDWDRLAADGGKEVVVRTSTGRFTARLWPDLAPATVSSFLRLVSEEYYAERVFHRVVPNFVAQGGGPLGDGFGAEDFSLRTETPAVRWDRPGLLGMASAGRDTEGVQFFVTHRPTPHLNGNYTIFGEVTAGQDVVDRITPGTRIEAVEVR